jgi:Mg2+ and Co2+ transporter CorA
MAKHDSMLLDLRKFFEEDNNDKNYFSHMVVAMEVSENGTPIGAAVKMKCSPILALGIIDLLHDKLSEAREQVLEELKEFEKDNMSVEQEVISETSNPFDKVLKSAMESISDEDKAFFADCQKRAIRAIIDGDEEKLKEITDEMRKHVENKTKKDDSSDDFDIEDFKGGF